MTAIPSTPPVALEDRHADEARLFSPSSARNSGAIAAVLARVLPPSARVLEIGSGTGEHAVAACAARADIRWQPSDPDARSRCSQTAWAAQAGHDRIAAPLDLDLLRPGWRKGLDPVDALVCINVIHIAPWSVAEALAAGAAEMLAPGRPVVLYGPYLEGQATAPSNLDFDRSLKARNPHWGVRQLDGVVALFRRKGFDLAERIGMPANNLSLVFVRRETA